MAPRGPFLAALLAALYAAAFDGAWRWSGALERLYRNAPPAQSAEGGGAAGYQSIRRQGEQYLVVYGFHNFDRRALAIKVRMSESVVWDSLAEFGVSQDAVKALDDWFQRAQTAAADKAKSQEITGEVSASSQEELDAKLRQAETFNARVRAALQAQLDGIQAEYDRRRQKLYADAGFRFRGESAFEVDFPKMVHRNRLRVLAVSEAFQRLAQLNGYGSEELIGAVTSMMQTAMPYQSPPDLVGNKIVAAMLPPPQALVQGWGNCGTKTTLELCILANWTSVRAVGVAIPEHYLMGLRRIPQQGDAYVEYKGDAYVLLEPTGPAWLPIGQIGENTEAFLKSGRDFEIDPL